MKKNPIPAEQIKEAERIARRVVGRMLGWNSDVDDVCQEVLIRAVKNWSRSTGCRGAWIAKIARNCVFTAVKRKSRRGFASLDLVIASPSPHLDPSALCELKEEVAKWEEIRKLLVEIASEWGTEREELLWTILDLRVLEGRSWSYVAESMGLASEGAAKTRWSRAWKAINKELVRRGSISHEELGLKNAIELAHVLAGTRCSDPSLPSAVLEHAPAA
jgi:RNA polymerase sigma factor (sigma-70 family)